MSAQAFPVRAEIFFHCGQYDWSQGRLSPGALWEIEVTEEASAS